MTTFRNGEPHLTVEDQLNEQEWISETQSYRPNLIFFLFNEEIGLKYIFSVQSNNLCGQICSNNSTSVEVPHEADGTPLRFMSDSLVESSNVHCASL